MAGSGSYLMNKSIVPDNSVNTATHTASRSPLFQRVTLFVIWAWLIVFALIPNILVVLASFMTRDEDSFLALPLTAESYLRFIDPLYVKVFLHSLSMASITTLICLILGYPFAWLVSRVSKKWQSFLMLLLIIPFWTNSLVRLYAVKLIIAANGLLSSALIGMGLIDEPLQILYTQKAVIGGLVYLASPQHEP